ncbi:MAG: LPD38 domain-containing protein, partial [Candidatus Competibacter denitrificans]
LTSNQNPTESADFRYSMPSESLRQRIASLEAVNVDFQISESTPIAQARHQVLAEAKRTLLTDARGEVAPRAFTAKNGDEIWVSMAGLRESISKHAGPQKMKILPTLDRLIQNSQFVLATQDVKSEKRHSPNVLGYRYYIAKANLDGKTYYVKLAVREIEDGGIRRKFYDHDLSEVSEVARKQGTAHLTAAGNPTATTSLQEIIGHLFGESQTENGNRYSRPGRPDAWNKDLPQAVKDMAAKIGADPKPLTERLSEMKGTLATRLRQGLVDRFARLADLDRQRFGTDFMDTDTALSAWVAAKMSKSPEGALEAAFLHGRLVWDEGALNVKETNKGLVKALEPVAQEGEMNRFWQWIIANRAERLKSEGREHLFTDAEIATGKQLDQGQMADGASRAQVYRRTLGRYRVIQRSILDIAQQAGLFTLHQRQQWEHDFYLPFYRVIEDEGEVRGPTAGGKLVRQKAFEKLKGGTEKLGDPLQNILKNWFHLLDASLKNRAATLALDTAAHLGVAQPVTDAMTDKTSVWVMKDGQKVHYNVADPLTLEAISAISAPPLSGWAIKALAATKRALTLGTTISPAFKARNLLRDSIAALAVSKLSPNAFGNIARGYQAAKEGSATQAALIAGGGTFRFGTLLEGDRDAAAKRIAGFKPDTVLDSKEKIQGVFDLMKHGLEKWNQFGDRLETANRAALYEQMRKENKTHLQASLAARDLMDFAQSGGWGATRFLITAVPFLNARIQGLDVLYRKGFKPLGKAMANQASPGEKQQAARFAMTTFMVSAASVALYLMFKDDKDFKEREQWDRDTYWWFKIPGTEQPFRIPKPFEIGALGTLAERLAEQLCDPEAGGELFIERMGAMLTQTFAFDPTPQLFKPLLDVAANKDSFTQRPIETLDMERLSPEMRKRYNTSALATGLSQAGLGKMGLSPVQVEHLIRGYFGWIGAQALLLGDMAARPALGLPEKPQKLKDVPIFGDLLNTFAPDGRGSRYVTEFYGQLQQIRQLHADAKLMQKLGDTGLSGFVQDHRKELALAAPMEQAARTMAEFGKMERRIAQDRTLSGQEKQAKIDQISERKQQMAKRLRAALSY